MAYLASIHKASSVRHAAKCSFLAPDEMSLVVARSNIADIYSFSAGALTLRTSFTVFGRINGILPFRPLTAKTDHLLIATDQYDYFTVSWDAEKSTIRNERKAEDVADRFLRDATCGPKYMADPSGRMLAMHVYEGMLLLIPLTQDDQKRKKPIDPEKIGNLEEHIPIRLLELKVLDICFLHGTKNPVVAILHRDGMADFTKLVTYEVVKSGGVYELKKWDIENDQLNEWCKTVIPVPEPLGGVMVVGETSLTYFPPAEKGSTLRKGLNDTLEFEAWGLIDSQRFMLSDKLNQLKIMLLELDDLQRVTDIKVETVGKTSYASELVYLGDGHVFVGSQSGDSQLVRLSPTGARCEILQTFSNIAPILDFQVLNKSNSSTDDPLQDLYTSGQTTIITASGGEFDGTLRSLKSGVGLEDSAILGEMDGVTGLWSIKSQPSDDFDDVLVVSLLDETRMFAFDTEGEVEELENLHGLSFDEQTVALRCLPDARILQVTNSKLKLIDTDGGTVVVEATLQGKVNAGSANDEYLVCNVGGNSLVAYSIKEDLKEVARQTYENEIACLFVSQRPNICAVGFWNTAAVQLLKMPSLEMISEEPLGNGQETVAIPRSIIVAQVVEGQNPHLLISMGDGAVHTYSLDPASAALSEKKTINLGTQAFYFHLVPRSPEICSVFAASDHPSMVYGDNGRLMYSAVTADRVTHLHSFNAAAFPNSVATIAGGELKISNIDPARNVHIKTLPFGEIVRRVAYSEERKLFAVVTIKLDLGLDAGKNETYFSAVRLVDENSFSVIAEFQLDAGEVPETLICEKLDNGNGTKSDKFLVGTGFAGREEEANSGRILVFEVTEDRQLSLLTQCQVSACVRRIQLVDDKIVTAQNKSIVLYSYTFPTPLHPSLTRLFSLRSHSEPIDLSVSNNSILVGDLMKGPSLLTYTPPTTPTSLPHLDESARVYSTHWTTAVSHWDASTVLSADTDGNVTLYQRSSSVLPEDQKRLSSIAEIHLGETVNRIRTIPSTRSSATGNMPVVPRAYVATGDGSLYLLGAIAERYMGVLMELQERMGEVVKGVGELEFGDWRAKRTEVECGEGPVRFVDGDFVERFLELAGEVQERICGGVSGVGEVGGVDGMRGLVEGLKRLH